MMRPLLLLTLVLGGLPCRIHAEDPATPRTVSFMFKQPVPLTTLTDTIAQLGGVNVVVAPGVETPISLSMREATPEKALEDLAKAAGLAVTRIPYVTARPTFLLTKTAIPTAALTCPEGPPSPGEKHHLTFGTPTPIATIVETLAAQGSFEVLESELPEEKLTLRLKDVTPREALHLIAHLAGLKVERDTTVSTETWIVARPGEEGTIPQMPLAATPSASPAVEGVRPPAIPPVRFSVNAIVPDDTGFTAVIEYEGETYLVRPGTPVPDSMQPRFEVKEVVEDCVEVFDRESKRIVSSCLELRED